MKFFPLRNPRTLCACHRVAFITASRVVPSGARNIRRTICNLLSRAGLSRLLRGCCGRSGRACSACQIRCTATCGSRTEQPHDARQLVPDLNQPTHGPYCHELFEILDTAERGSIAYGALRERMHAVVVINPVDIYVLVSFL